MSEGIYKAKFSNQDTVITTQFEIFNNSIDYEISTKNLCSQNIDFDLNIYDESINIEFDEYLITESQNTEYDSVFGFDLHNFHRPSLNYHLINSKHFFIFESSTNNSIKIQKRSENELELEETINNGFSIQDVLVFEDHLYIAFLEHDSILYNQQLFDYSLNLYKYDSNLNLIQSELIGFYPRSIFSKVKNDSWDFIDNMQYCPNLYQTNDICKIYNDNNSVNIVFTNTSPSTLDHNHRQTFLNKDTIEIIQPIIFHLDLNNNKYDTLLYIQPIYDLWFYYLCDGIDGGTLQYSYGNPGSSNIISIDDVVYDPSSSSIYLSYKIDAKKESSCDWMENFSETFCFEGYHLKSKNNKIFQFENNQSDGGGITDQANEHIMISKFNNLKEVNTYKLERDNFKNSAERQFHNEGDLLIYNTNLFYLSNVTLKDKRKIYKIHKFDFDLNKVNGSNFYSNYDNYTNKHYIACRNNKHPYHKTSR